MTVNIAFLDALAEAFNRHDVDAVMSMMTEDCVYLASVGDEAEGRRIVGKSAVRQAFADFFKTIPDARWNEPRHFIAGDRGCSEWRFTCTQQDGRKVNAVGCDLFHFRDGKVQLKSSMRKQATR